MTKNELASASPWDIAKHFNCHFTGDMNPIDYGGVFYDSRDWEKNGYACAVSFMLWNNKLFVQRGTIHKWDNDKQRENAFSYIELPESEHDNIHAQIEACLAHNGIELEGCNYPDAMSYDLENWTEANIWKSVKGWIEELGK